MLVLLLPVAAALAALSSASATALPQDADAVDLQTLGFNYQCPERNGLFADDEQCDLYYVCEDGVATPQLCADGELFDISIRNRERCKFPHNIDCGKREFVQEPRQGLPEECPRANGFFDHINPNICNKFYTCSDGVFHEMDCANPLVFDVKIGGCVREGEASAEAKVCGDVNGVPELKSIDGFTCPGKQEIGPQGLLQAHPIYAHPSDCQFFFTCFFGTDPNKFGCTKGQVFDEATQVCKPADEVRECACWYECPEDCPTGECAPDCTCLSESELAALSATGGPVKRRK